LKFEFERTIRGLVIDKAKGNLLKLSRHAAIRMSYHGLDEINFKTQKEIYKSTYIDIKDKNFDKVDTSFSLAISSLFAQLVAMKDSVEGKNLPDYMKIAEDLNDVLDEGHRDESLKSVVIKNLDKFIYKDPEMVRGLLRYIQHEKKFFIATNSDFKYAKTLLDYAINPYLKGGKTWQDVFTFVIVNARKPSFFFEEAEFKKIEPKTGKETLLSGPLTPGVYSGGNAKTFTSELGIEPDEILYIGDHIYGDIVRLKKDCAWRTALVVEELDHEVDCLVRANPYMVKINKLMTQKIPLEIKIDELISKKIEGKKTAKESEIKALIKKSSGIDEKISALIKKQQKIFNAYWGEVMRIGVEESYFAYQVERFACIYMAQLSCLLQQSPRMYFRSFRRPFPHEP
jgi:HAD superfamily 5'-nucleotidase-like hydrolase